MLDECERIGFLDQGLPTLMMLLGFAVAWLFYICVRRTSVAARPRAGALYRFLLNKWYFDEIYDTCSSPGRSCGSVARYGRAATAG